MSLTLDERAAPTDRPGKLGIIDTDVHPLKLREHQQRGSGVLSYLPQRWQRHAAQVGVARGGWPGGERPPAPRVRPALGHRDSVRRSARQ